MPNYATPQLPKCGGVLRSCVVGTGKLAYLGNHNPSPWPAKTIRVPCGLVIKELVFTGGEHPALLGINGLSAGAVRPLKNKSQPSVSMHEVHTSIAC